MSTIPWRLRIECTDPPLAARFWQRAMGWPVTALDETAATVQTEGPAIRFEINTSQRAARRIRLGSLDLLVDDVPAAEETLLRLGAARTGDGLTDPAHTFFRLVQDPDGATLRTPPAPDFHRYVAIGDSTTEGLVDGDPEHGWRGWADRFAARLAATSDHPVEYANLAISGYRLFEIRQQLEPALAMEPDLMTIVGGVNDILGLRPDFAQMEEHLDAMFAAAVGRGIRVLSFTMPDISRANPVATIVRDRISTLNELIRRTCYRNDVPFVDFERIPTASDPRLWGEDRLHINTMGHLRVAAALAWLVNLPGSDRSWAAEIDSQPGRQADGVTDAPGSEIGSNLHWARRHFGPWVVRGIRGAQYRQGSEAKRPLPTVVEIEGDPGHPGDERA